MSLLSLCLIATLTYQPIHAEDFAGQESHYIKLCSSSKLTRKSIDDIAQEISKIDTKIQSAKSELNYVQKNITAL